jgi:hypothetical protein
MGTELKMRLNSCNIIKRYQMKTVFLFNKIAKIYQLVCLAMVAVSL